MKTKMEDRTLFDEEDDTGTAELIPAEEATMALRPEGMETTLMMSLARMEQGMQVLDRAHRMLKGIRMNALSLTGPGDWIAMKATDAPHEAASCMLKASGAKKISQFFMIRADPAQPTDAQGAFRPEVERGPDGEIQLHGWMTGYCGLTGERLRVSGSRSSSEKFIGRGPATGASDLVMKADLARSLETLLKKKLVAEFSGTTSVPVRELADAGVKVEEIVGGSGYGTSGDRAAQSVTSESIKEKQDELRKEILARTSGDKEAARDLLRDITIWTGKDGKERWASNVEQLTKDYPMKLAWENLRKHPVFGDAARKEGEE